MSGTSKTTTVIGIRLPNNIVATIKRRVAKGNYDSLSSYLRERIIYDITRSHIRHNHNKTVGKQESEGK